jgi:uncharacterized membrane protein YidH (DUF202 family)
MSLASDAALPVGAIQRTRMSWIRTSLAVIITAFLLVRGGFTASEPPVLAILATMIGALAVAVSMTRYRLLGTTSPPLMRRIVPHLVSGAILALAVIACLRMLLPA